MANGEAGAPKGNSNYRKGRMWKDAIKQALAEKDSKSDQMAALRELAHKLIEAAQAGEGWALKEIGDRLDGRPAQAIIGGDEDDPAINVSHKIEFVNPEFVEELADESRLE